jgi:SpoVK/Ycf46/Vps4 family AAA+-type ATPase
MQVQDIATQTAGYSGSDLTNLCEDASAGPLKQVRTQSSKRSKRKGGTVDMV